MRITSSGDYGTDQVPASQRRRTIRVGWPAVRVGHQSGRQRFGTLCHWQTFRAAESAANAAARMDSGKLFHWALAPKVVTTEPKPNRTQHWSTRGQTCKRSTFGLRQLALREIRPPTRPPKPPRNEQMQKRNQQEQEKQRTTMLMSFGCFTTPLGHPIRCGCAGRVKEQPKCPIGRGRAVWRRPNSACAVQCSASRRLSKAPV